MSKRVLDGFKTTTDNAETRTVSASTVDLHLVLEEFKITLRNQAARLTLESQKGLLGAASSNALVNYIKAVQALIAKEDAALDSMTDAELEKVLKDNK